MNKIFYVIGIVCVVIVGYVVGMTLRPLISNNSLAGPSEDNSSKQLRMAEGIINSVKIVSKESRSRVHRNNSTRIGKGNSIITVYTDVKCIHCARLNHVLLQLSERGDFQFEIRHFVKGDDTEALVKHRMFECGNVLGLPQRTLLIDIYDQDIEHVAEKLEQQILDSRYSIEDFHGCVGVNSKLVEIGNRKGFLPGDRLTA